MRTSSWVHRVVTRFLLKQPERLLAIVLVAFICSSGLALLLSSSTAIAHDDAWAVPVDMVVHGRRLSEVDGRSATAMRGPSLRAPMVLVPPRPVAEESATLKALSAIEHRLAAMDSRLAATEHAATRARKHRRVAEVRTTQRAVASAPAVDTQMGMQVAALSQTVAAVLSLVAAEHQKMVPPAPPPQVVVKAGAAPAPSPAQSHVSAWDEKQKLDDIKRDVASRAEHAAKAQIEPEITKLMSTIKRLAGQNTNRYTQVLKDLTKLAPDVPTVTEGWTIKETGNKSSVASTLNPEQSRGHGCRSPPCSRDTESCKYHGNCCADLMYEMLSDFSEFLNTRNVTHLVVAGTLLGAVRDKDIIPYTSDIDMLIPREGWEHAKEINFIKGRKKSYYFMQDPQESHCARLCAVWEGLPVNRASFTNHFDWDTDQLGSDVQYYMDIYDEKMDFTDKLKHLHFPVSMVTIRNRTFPAPHEQDLWVEAKYGPSWRTPDHQSHGGRVPYPTLDEAKKWSQSMLVLRKARTDAVLGHRLLERASVDHKSGHIEVQDAGQEMHVPDVEAKRVIIEGLSVSYEGNVTNGTVVVWPPDTNEGQITNYVLFWAAERVRGWDLKLEHLGKQIMSVSRCSTGGDPFKACAQRGLPLHAPLPLNIMVPVEATHLVVVSANEAGSSSKSQSAGLADGRPGGSDALFTRRTELGFLGGLASDSPALASCVAGTTIAAFAAMTTDASSAGAPGLLLKDSFEKRIVSLMLKHTSEDMQAALRALVEWLFPVVSMLEACSKREKAAQVAHASLVRALRHLNAPKEFNYQPGKALDIDGTTIFLGINHAIAELRHDKPAQFGAALGEFLKPLGVAPAEKSFETKEERRYHAPETAHVSEHTGSDYHLSERAGLHTLGKDIKYLVVSVKTAHDAHIAFFPQEVNAGLVPENASVLYEFVIGSSLNRQAAIRFGKSGKNEAEARLENALDAEQFRDFWFSTDTSTGRVALGRGRNISADVIVNMTDTPPGVRGAPSSFAVMTPASFGAWRFPEVAQDAESASSDEASFIVGQLVQRRNSNGLWGTGYVTSVMPLKVTVVMDPEEAGETWGEVRPIKQEPSDGRVRRDKRIAARHTKRPPPATAKPAAGLRRPSDVLRPPPAAVGATHSDRKRKRPHVPSSQFGVGAKGR